MISALSKMASFEGIIERTIIKGSRDQRRDSGVNKGGGVPGGEIGR